MGGLRSIETMNLQGQGHRQRSQWKQLMKVYLHLMCERVIDQGLRFNEIKRQLLLFFFYYSLFFNL